MPDEATVTYGLKFQARAIAADVTNTGASRWFVGTNALREANEVQALEYDEDAEALRCAAVYPHQNEVWHIAPSPHDPGLMFTIGNAGGTYNVTLWRLPGPLDVVAGGDSGDGALQEVCQLEGQWTAGPIRCVCWNPSQRGQAASMDDERLRLWAVREADAECTANARAGDLQQPWTGAWDPHDGARLATAAGNDVQVWDTRSMDKTFEVEGAGHAPLRCLDWAPRSSHVLLTGGDDCALRLWDLRMASAVTPLAEMGGHRHWVWGARFNPHHEQLLASCSSDASCALWYVPKLLPDANGGGAGGAAGGGGGGTAGGGAGGGAGARAVGSSKAESYEEDHEDSVYGLAWSASDPWLFASLSYDGRVVVNRVPSQIKYKIII